MFALKTRLQRAILARLTFNDGKLIPKATLLEEVCEDLGEEVDAKSLDKAFDELVELLADVSMIKFEGKKTGFKAKLGKNIVRILPILIADPDLSEEQITLIKFFQRAIRAPFRMLPTLHHCPALSHDESYSI